MAETTTAAAAVMARQEWVHLNVGGTTFATTRATLCSDRQSMLARMFSPAALLGSQRDANGAYLIDRDPILFRHILNFLRSGDLFLDEGVSADALLGEANFFQLENLIDLLQPHNRADITRRDVLRRLGTLGLSFARLRLHDADLSNLSLSGINFQKVAIRGTQFCDSLMRQTVFTKAEGDRVNFANANLTSAVMKLTFMTRSNFANIKAPNANFCGANLSGSDFSGAALQGALFQKACLRGCSFRGANLWHAKFQEADLRDADFTGAVLDECHVTDADLRRCTIDLIPRQRPGTEPFRIYTKGAVLLKEQYLDIPEEFRVKLEVTVVSPLPEAHAFRKKITEEVAKNACVVYLKGAQQDLTNDRLHKRIFSILESLEIKYVTRNAFDDPSFDVALSQYTSQTFLPKVFVNGRFIDGFSERSAIRASKRELYAMMEAAVANEGRQPFAIPQSLPVRLNTELAPLFTGPPQPQLMGDDFSMPFAAPPTVSSPLPVQQQAQVAPVPAIAPVPPTVTNTTPQTPPPTPTQSSC